MKTILLSILLFCSAASAQNFSIDWFTVDGGGGASAAGGFSVSGTIGQPDAGFMSGGGYAVVGGFWSFAATETLSLAVSNSPTGVVVYWDRPAYNWVLDESPVLVTSPPHPWTMVPFPYETNATHILVTIPGPVGNKFYRLRKL
jgi:hypothetical protein